MNRDGRFPRRGTLVAAWLVALVLAGCGLLGGHGGGDSDGGSGGSSTGPAVGSQTPVASQVNERYEVTHEDVAFDDATGEAYVRGVLLVYFAPGATSAQRAAAVALVDGEVIGQMDAFDEYQLRVDAPDEAALEELRERLESAEGVEVVSLDRVVALTAEDAPNDPWDGSGLGGSDASWWAEAVSAPAAWACYERPGLAPVTVAVVDNGFDMDHEDLASRVRRASDADAANRNVRDHGTHVAGIVGAAADNGRGIAGMVWRGDVLCFDASPSTDPIQPDFLPDSAVEQGLLASVRAGARVINFSNGASRHKNASEWAAEQGTVDAAGRLYSRRVGALLAEGHDFVVVQSAGNGDKGGQGIDASYNLEFAAITSANCDTSYVAASEILDRVVIVGAAERQGGGYRLTSFSNGGPQVDVCAPGQDIYSTVAGGYAYKKGTSMAAPIVTGVAALVWAADPGLSGREVKQLVCMSAQHYADGHPGAPYASGTYPLVDAETAVYDALALANQAGKPDPSLAEEPAAEGDGAYAAFERYLRDIYDRGTVEATSVSLPADGGDTDSYQGFAVDDVDGDGAPELLVVHEMTSSSGVSFGCLSDVIEYEPGSGTTLARRCITSFVPQEASWAGTGWLTLYAGAPSYARVYLPASDELAAGYDLPATSYLSLERMGDDWHLLTCGAFSVDGDQVLDDASYGRVAAELEGAAPSPVPLQPVFMEAIDAIAPDWPS